MKKNVIKINEKQLRQMISESVKHVLWRINESKQEFPYTQITIDSNEFPKVLPQNTLVSVCELVSDYMFLEADLDSAGEVDGGYISNREEIVSILQDPVKCKYYNINPLSFKQIKMFMKALDKYLSGLDWRDFNWKLPYEDDLV